MYDDRVEVYRLEKKKTEKLLTDLLPRLILLQMKKGQIPQPETFDSVTIFLTDIVSFTTLSSESSAHQVNPHKITLLTKMTWCFITIRRNVAGLRKCKSRTTIFKS